MRSTETTQRPKGMPEWVVAPQTTPQETRLESEKTLLSGPEEIIESLTQVAVELNLSLDLQDNLVFMIRYLYANHQIKPIYSDWMDASANYILSYIDPNIRNLKEHLLIVQKILNPHFK